ncbi:hypothetical protein BGZ99_008605, partial [Dissophora globulifera]
MGHLSLKIQTSTLFLKAKLALSLHRKSSPSFSSSSSSSPSPTHLSTLSPSTPLPLDSAVSPPLSSVSTTTTTLITPSTSTAPIFIGDTSSEGTDRVEGNVLSPKARRSGRFKVKAFASFRDRSTSPPHQPKRNNTTMSLLQTTTSAMTATSGSTSTGQVVVSVNPYSSSWCPSTVAALKSPLRSASYTKGSGGLDLLQSSHHSPAPNMILQPSPALDLSQRLAAGGSPSLTADNNRDPEIAAQ